MSSVRRLKQKGIAFSGTPLGAKHLAPRLWRGFTIENTSYDYRKAAFASLPPATTVRPMRVIRAKLAAAYEAAGRAIRAGVQAGLDWAQIGESTAYVQAELRQAVRLFKLTRSLADAGHGKVVHALAR